MVVAFTDMKNTWGKGGQMEYLLSLGYLCDICLEKSKYGVQGEVGQAVQLRMSVNHRPVAFVALGLREASKGQG